MGVKTPNVGFLSVVLGAALSSLGADRVVIGDFENGLGGWTFSNGAEFPGARGSLERSERAAFSGRYGARLSFDFTGGGAYVAMYYTFSRPIRLAGFEFRVRKPPAARVTVRVTDSTGQTVQKTCFFRHGAWQGVSVRWGDWSGHWGGADDGVVHQPVRTVGILVERRGLGELRGEVAVDEVAALTERGKAEGTRKRIKTEYTVADLTKPLPPSTTLLGDPEKLKVVLETDGSEGEVRIVCASHFQSFEKILLLPRKSGRRILETEVPPRSWRYFGGENDGRLHGPVRLTGVEVRGRGRKGVRLLEVRAVTHVTRESAVTLFPFSETKGGRAEFGCRLVNVLPKEAEVEVRLDVTDWEGRLLYSRDEVVSAAPAGGSPGGRLLRAEIPFEGRFFLNGCYAWRLRSAQGIFGRGSGAARRKVSVGAVRWNATPGSRKLEPESPWGVGLYLYRYPESEEGFRRMAQAARLARDAGVKWSREEFQWHRIEPQEGRFNWYFYDRMVKTALENGIRIYGLLAYWSSWTEPYTPKGIEAYARWASAVVKRYRDRIHHWEVWNEPNIFFWQGPREMYAELLKKSYAAIKSADPGAKVLGLSTAGIDVPFIKRMLALEAPFDILTIHPYRGVLREEEFMEELKRVRRLVGGRSVWITEMGWPTLPGGTDEAEQARLLARTYLSAVGSGAVENVSWYDFREDGGDPLYNEHHFGVVRRDLTPKAAYLALACVCRTLGSRKSTDGTPGGKSSGEKGLFAYRFGVKGEALALWCDSPLRVVRVVSAAGRVTLLNTVGERSIQEAGSNGEFLIPLAPRSPILLTAGRGIERVETVLILEGEGAARAGADFPVAWKLLRPVKEEFVLTLLEQGGWRSDRRGIRPGPGIEAGVWKLTAPGDTCAGGPVFEVRKGSWRGAVRLDTELFPEWFVF